MTDREKMLEVLQGLCIKEKIGEGLTMREKFEQIADQLIANGVTVKEPQKPMTAEEAKSLVLWDTDKPHILWIEHKTNKERNRYVYVTTVGELYQLSQLLSSYGNNVRCWAEKPTDEERQAAEWLK